MTNEVSRHIQAWKAPGVIRKQNTPAGDILITTQPTNNGNLTTQWEYIKLLRNLTTNPVSNYQSELLLTKSRIGIQSLLLATDRKTTLTPHGN